MEDIHKKRVENEGGKKHNIQWNNNTQKRSLWLCPTNVPLTDENVYEWITEGNKFVSGSKQVAGYSLLRMKREFT